MTKIHQHLSITLSCIVVTLLLTLSVSHAQNTAQDPLVQKQSLSQKIISWFTPEEKPTGPSPTETLQAPFLSKGPKAPQNSLRGIYDTANGNSRSDTIHNQAIPHRSHLEIEDWLTEAVGKSLNFELADMKGFGKTLQPYYSQEGVNTFKAFLMGINAIAIIQKNDKKMSSYLTDTPLLKKEGAEDGLYRWVYDVPVLLSYIDNSKPPRELDPVIQNYLLRLTIVRTPITKVHKEGILIAHWAARKVKKDQ
ncbi:MAG: DotI/IcmL/TraM family protein [Alphaproteobacteria bacterium]|nr:DotI/IcmL/TraM family protein [Alphaproteobacteria bacterium]